jgi:hypothetical protein
MGFGATTTNTLATLANTVSDNKVAVDIGSALVAVDLATVDVDALVDGLGDGKTLSDVYGVVQNVEDYLSGGNTGVLHDGYYSAAELLGHVEGLLAGWTMGPLHDGSYGMVDYISGNSYVGPLYQMEQYISGNYMGPLHDGAYGVAEYLYMIYNVLSQMQFDNGRLKTYAT